MMEGSDVTCTGTDDAAQPATPAQQKAETPQACEEHREKLLDEALDESFPASDPPSIARPAIKGC